MNKILLSSLVVALTAVPALAETAVAQSQRPEAKVAINKTLSQKTAAVSRSLANLRKSTFNIYVSGKMLDVNSGKTTKHALSTLAVRIDKNWLLLRGSYGFVTDPVFSVNGAKVSAADVFSVGMQSYTLIKIDPQNKNLATTVGGLNQVVSLFFPLDGNVNAVPAKITATRAACFSKGLGSITVKNRGAIKSAGHVAKDEKSLLAYNFASPEACNGFLVGSSQKHGATSLLLGQSWGNSKQSFEALDRAAFDGMKAVIGKEDPAAWSRIVKHAITDQKDL